MIHDPLSPSRQIRFQQLLAASRKTFLHEALAVAVKIVDHKVLKTELSELIPDDVQQSLAAVGIRDEQVFPAPVLLTSAPQLLGYYRLLLGIPQKSFYASASGMSPFKSMEEKGILRARQTEGLPELCRAMSVSLSELVRQISPMITALDVRELPILTYGAQLQGSNNNSIGKLATIDVFLAVSDIVKAATVEETAQRITLINGAGRKVYIILSSDPDIRIEEEFSSGPRRVVAIEIKGGTDKSNAHNRAGEAEKSHQKAKNDGFRDYWTLIAKRGLDVDRLKSESPTTNEWFDVAHVLAREGEDWLAFVQAICAQSGIAVPPTE